MVTARMQCSHYMPQKYTNCSDTAMFEYSSTFSFRYFFFFRFFFFFAAENTIQALRRLRSNPIRRQRILQMENSILYAGRWFATRRSPNQLFFFEAWLRYAADSDEDESFDNHDDSDAISVDSTVSASFNTNAFSIGSNDSTITVEFNGDALNERNDHEIDGQADVVEPGRFLPLHYRREDLDLNVVVEIDMRDHHNDDHDTDEDFEIVDFMGIQPQPLPKTISTMVYASKRPKIQSTQCRRKTATNFTNRSHNALFIQSNEHS